MAEPKKDKAIPARPQTDRQRPGPKPDPTRARSALITIRCRAEYRDWLSRFSDREGVDVAEMFDQLILAHARDKGFEMPPKR